MSPTSKSSPVTLVLDIWLTIAGLAGADVDESRGRSTLLALALVSKEISSAAYSELYRCIKLQWRASVGTDLLRTFEDNPRLCLLVREINVTCFSADDWEKKWHPQRVGFFKTPAGPHWALYRNGAIYDGPGYRDLPWIHQYATGQNQLWFMVTRLVNLRKVSLEGFKASIDPLLFGGVTDIVARLSHLRLHKCGRDTDGINLRPAWGVHGLLAFLGSIKSLDVDGLFKEPLHPIPLPRRLPPAIQQLSLYGVTLPIGHPSFDLNLDLSRINTLSIDSPSKIPHICDILPTCAALRSLSITATDDNFPLPFWTVVANLALTEVHFRCWPSNQILATLPPTITLLHINDTRLNGLADALTYKEQYLPALERLWIQSDLFVNNHMVWCETITSQAQGFSFEIRSTVAINGDLPEICRTDRNPRKF